MYYKKEFDVHSFEFWSGAYDRTKNLNYDQLTQLGQYIEDMFCDDIPEDVAINDFVWFDCDDFFSSI